MLYIQFYTKILQQILYHSWTDKQYGVSVSNRITCWITWCLLTEWRADKMASRYIYIFCILKMYKVTFCSWKNSDFSPIKKYENYLCQCQIHRYLKETWATHLVCIYSQIKSGLFISGYRLPEIIHYIIVLQLIFYYR